MIEKIKNLYRNKVKELFKNTDVLLQNNNINGNHINHVLYLIENEINCAIYNNIVEDESLSSLTLNSELKIKNIFKHSNKQKQSLLTFQDFLFKVRSSLNRLTFLFLLKGAYDKQISILDYIDNICNLVEEKNKKYGSAILNPLPILFKKDEIDVKTLIKLQMNNKLMRMINSKKDDEDAVLDFLGYSILYEIYIHNTFLEK